MTDGSTAAGGSSGGGMTQTQVNDRLVAQYLHSRGFRQAEAHLRNEARLSSSSRNTGNYNNNNDNLPPDARGLDEASIPNFVLFYNEAEASNPGALEQSYTRLRRWIGDSIDAYRLELLPALFPIFVHVYLDLVRGGHADHARRFLDTCRADHQEAHGPDLARLAGIVDPAHIDENELAQAFRQNKYGVKMSKYAFELLLGFLQDHRFMLLLRIINQYVSIQAISERPEKTAAAILGTASAFLGDGTNRHVTERDDGAGLVGHQVSHLDAFNAQPVRLGRLPPDVAFLKDVERALAMQDTGADHDVDDLRSHIDTIIKSPPEDDAPVTDNSVPLPPRRRVEIQDEINHLRDIKNQIRLGPSSLPSICCYTFHNTQGGIACLRASASAEVIAAGFSDSFIKLWSKRDPDTSVGVGGQSYKTRKSRGSSTKASSSAEITTVDVPRPTTLIGHSGTVFGLDFSPKGDYLLSASEDKTVRLWSVTTRSNLVIYKGHNYPVFDVSFGPHGLYFATASYDRTARLWSCDHLFPLRVFAGHLADVSTVRFHPNSNYVVTGSADRTCRMWDVQRGACVRIFSRQGGGGVGAVAMSPDGRTMASAGDDRAIRLWDLGSGQCIKTMVGHASRVYSLDFSRDGALLASGGADDSVRLWDVKRADVHAIGGVTSDHMSGVAAGVTAIPSSTMSGSAGSVATVDGITATGTGGGSGSHPTRLDQVAAYPTKRTPIYTVQFTPRNLLLSLGIFEGA